MRQEMEIPLIIGRATEMVGTMNSQNSNWYVGITNNPARRFREHGVDTSQGRGETWACWRTPSAEIARAVERELISRDFQGGNGGGNDTAIFVYIYLISELTNESVEREMDSTPLLESAVTECDLCWPIGVNN